MLKPYISPEGAVELASLRVGPVPPATEGGPPVALLARLPSDVCGCPEELWRVDGIIYLIHMEEDGSSEILIYTGEEEHERASTATTLCTLRAEMFALHATMGEG